MDPISHELIQGFGLQYFPDTGHTSESDSLRWLPILERMNIQWLVINAELKRAVSEEFIRKTIEFGINPILRFQFSLINPPHANELEPFFSAYQKWGIKYISFFEKPNQSSSWNPESWAQHDLVERFLDRFLNLAKPALKYRINSIFPPLYPGGNYWDTLFLEQALSSLKRRGEFELLNQMILSAYGWTFNHPLDWGKGGPQKWPTAKPYSLFTDTEDHRGFGISEWYSAISKNILNQELPLFLFESGLTGPSENETGETKILARVYQEILKQNESSYHENLGEEGKFNINPSANMAVIFSLLSSETAHTLQRLTWFNSDGSATYLGEQMMSSLQKTIINREIPKRISSEGMIDTYLLLPSFEWGVADWHLDMVRSFVKKNRPSLGFSLKDACHAKQVIVIGGEEDFSEDDLDKLRLQGCLVNRIQGDGTSIATQLAER